MTGVIAVKAMHHRAITNIISELGLWLFGGIGMSEINRMTGTPWHVEKYTRKEGDDRRHRARCKYLRRKDSYCIKVVGKCRGAAHCWFYVERLQNEEIKVEKTELIKPVTEPKKTSVEQATVDTNQDIPQNIWNSFKVGKHVWHEKFRFGRIIARDNNKITIRFWDEKEMMFDLEYCIRKNILKRVHRKKKNKNNVIEKSTDKSV